MEWKSKELSQQHRHLEFLLVAIVLGALPVVWTFAVLHPWLLHLYYLPVVLTGFYLGCYRARMMSLLGIVTAVVSLVPDLINSQADKIPLETLLAFGSWGITLILVAILVGTLSDAWRNSLDDLHATHKKDVLIDALTGVANRRAFENELTKRLSEWQRNQTPLALMMVDIDHFKSFNDRHGHQAGDAVLRDVAQVLQNAVRDADVVARYGGEEFAVILPGLKSPDAREIAERARSTIESTRFFHEGLNMRLTVSVGIAHPVEGEEASSFTQRADAALYCSKEAGRNCAHFHDGQASQRFGAGTAVASTDQRSQLEEGVNSADAYSDDTTGLPSAKVFLQELRRRAAEINRYGGEISVALIDIDSYIATSGQDARARKSLLATAARLTASILRESDLVARYEDSSLVVLLPSTSLQSALIPLHRLGKSAADYSNPQYPSLSYSVSIAVAQLQWEERAGSILQRVETALDAAIESGRNCVCVHDGAGCAVRTDVALESEVEA